MSQDDQESTLARVSKATQEVLTESLRQRGLETVRRGDWLELSTGKLAIQLTAEKCQSYPQGWMVQLSFDIRPEAGAGLMISDTNVGVGESLEAAVAESVTTWLDGVFSTVRQSLGAMDADSSVNIYDIVTVNRERAEETSWEAYAGPFQFRGGTDRQKALATYLAEQPPLVTLLIDQLTDLLTERQESLVCIKLLLQAPAQGQPIVECKANNQDWLEGRAALATFAWPTESAGMLFKQFVVIKRGESRTAQALTEGPPQQKRSGCAGMIALGSVLIGLIILAISQF